MTDFNEAKIHLDRPVSQTVQRNPGYAQRRDFFGDLTDAVRDNPLPAALIGMGILWMFTGGSKTSLGDAVTSRAPGAVAGTFAKGAGKVGKSVLHGAEALGASLAEAAQSSIDAVSDAADRVGHTFTSSSNHQTDTAYGSRGNPKYGRDAENHLPDRDTQYASSSQNGLQQRLSEFFDERPLVLGAAGLALGAGIAASLPVSKPERQAFGKASDQLRDKVSEVMGQAKDMASAAVEEVEAHGISTQAVRDGLNDVTAKAKF